MMRTAFPEKKLEEYLVEKVEAAGGLCIKQTSPGDRGIPDRLIVWPRNGWAQHHWVELKVPGGSVKPWQERWHKRLRERNAFVRVIWTHKMVDEYVEEYGARAR